MAKTTHTRRGTCQVCGAVQAIDNGSNITAKHGYKVAGYGFFAGVCPGARHVPAELSLVVTHAIIAQLEEAALAHDAEAVAYRAHTTLCTTYTEWDHSVIRQHDGYTTRGGYVERAITDETPAHIVDDAQTKAAAIAEQNARYARQHVAMMREFIVPRLGQEFHAPKEVVRAERSAAKAKAVEGVRFPTKASRKDALDKLSRAYDKAARVIQNAYLALPEAKRTEAKTEIYYSFSGLHNWHAGRAAAVLNEFPSLASVVEQIDALKAEREAIKAAK
jgi:hypothetical protein